VVLNPLLHGYAPKMSDTEQTIERISQLGPVPYGQSLQEIDRGVNSLVLNYFANQSLARETPGGGWVTF